MDPASLVAADVALKKKRKEHVKGDKKNVSTCLINCNTEKRRQDAAPARVGKKKKKKTIDSNIKLPQINPTAKCRLRLLRLDRVKDYLLMEEEFIRNQERLKP